MPLRVINASQDKHNGHVTVDLQIIERNGKETKTGAVETHSIDPTMLGRMYGGNMHSFLEATHAAMLDRHNARKTAVSDILALKGQEIEF